MDMDMKRALSKADTMEEWALMMGVDMPVDEEPAQNETVFLRFGGPTSSNWTILCKFTKWDILTINLCVNLMGIYGVCMYLLFV